MRADHPQTDTHAKSGAPGVHLRLLGTPGSPVVVGDVLGGRYMIRSWLAAGGMSEVWCARDERLGQRVAAKIATEGGGVPGPALLAHEAELLRRLDHPGIVRALDVGAEAGRGYLIMPRLDGFSLSSLIRRLAPARSAARCPAVTAGWFRTVTRIMIEVIDAVASAHARAVIHRDLKADNVILVPGGRPVLIDFGLGGRIDAPGPDADRLTGTPVRLAPEQIRTGRAGTDVRTEVYQLGLLLQELLTLQPVFESACPEAMTRIVCGEVPRPTSIDPRIPPALEVICRMATAAEPDRRYPEVRAMSADLRRCLRAFPPAAPAGRWLVPGRARSGARG